MSRLERSSLSFLGLVAVSGALALGGCRAHTQERPVAVSPRAATFTVDGQVALHSLMALSDAHLQKLADDMRLLAATDAARSADWERIRTPLTAAARMNVPAVNWFALPDGSYWSVQESREAGNLSDRPYWPGLLAGQTVVGDLVISRATGRNTAIVAVPVRGDENAVVGVLGASVHLDSLSARIKQEMDLEPNHLFYSLDTEPLVGLHIDPETIFLHPWRRGTRMWTGPCRKS